LLYKISDTNDALSGSNADIWGTKSLLYFELLIDVNQWTNTCFEVPIRCNKGIRCE